MEYLKLIFFLLLFPALLYGQETIDSKMTPYTNSFRSFFREYKDKHVTYEQLKNAYLVNGTGDGMFVNVFIELADNFDLNEIRKSGVHIHSVIKDIVTAQVSVRQIETIASLPSVKRLQLGIPVEEKMDKAKLLTHVDKVQSGIELPNPFKGKDVVIGIIDGGFEYGHINFYTPDRKSVRIKRVWNQNGFKGNPPAGFSYGTEYQTESDILTARYDTKSETHGTHVAGIAAGADTASVYGGVAPEADIVLVSFNRNSVDNVAVADGIKYIFDYAESVGKPCVVNMSLGSFIGPRDGTSVFDRMCDQMQGKGKLLVGAVGNEGRTNIHISKDISPLDTLKTFLSLQFANVDIWGDVDKSFKMQIVVYSKVTHKEVFFSNEVDASVSGMNTFSFPESIGNISGKVNVATERNPVNNRTNAYLDALVYTLGPDYYVGLKIWGDKGTVHAWGGNQTAFTGNGINGWMNGDKLHTISEIGGTGKGIISVGAYVSKNEYTNISDEKINTGGTLEDIAVFSSLGPTSDGRMKPDITAPGESVISSYSSIVAIEPSQKPFLVFETIINKSKYYYGAMNGTSMAAPHVTGILATWLEAKPDLTPDEVRSILAETSMKDSFTGTSANNSWGNGKIDAWNGLKSVMSLTGNSIDREKGRLWKVSVYPNPNEGKFNIVFSDDDTNVNLSVYALNGQNMYNAFIGNVRAMQKNFVDLCGVDKGIYILTVKGDHRSDKYRFMVQ